VQHAEAVSAPKVMCFEICAGRHEVSAAHAELVSRGVRPRRLWVTHGRIVALNGGQGELQFKSGRGLPQSKTLRDFERLHQLLEAR
jgi:hypothetical protein